MRFLLRCRSKSSICSMRSRPHLLPLSAKKTTQWPGFPFSLFNFPLPSRYSCYNRATTKLIYWFGFSCNVIFMANLFTSNCFFFSLFFHPPCLRDTNLFITNHAFLLQFITIYKQNIKLYYFKLFTVILKRTCALFV